MADLFPGYPARTRAISDADLDLAREQFKAILDQTGAMRRRWKSDHEYIDGVTEDAAGNPVGKMWSEAERRAMGNRPAIEVDMISGPIAQVSNTLAESKPAADMVPIGGGSDVEKAEVWEAMLRRIQTTPLAEYASAYAGDHLTKIGIGAWLLRARYPDYNGAPDDPANWEMEIEREWIENQHAVYCGAARRPDGLDREVAFILQPFTREQFNELTAKDDDDEFEAARAAFAELSPADRSALSAWCSAKTVTLASWYRVKTRAVTITGQTVTGPRTRTVKHRYVCHSLISATKEYGYEEIEIPFIPIVWGEAKRVNVDGERDVRGMVRRGRQPQDMVNVWNSYIAETIAKAGRQEVIGYDGQIDQHNEEMWDLTRRRPYRLAHPIDVNGRIAPLPQIVSLEPPIQAMSVALQQAESNVLKATLHYDAASDETNASRSKESGVARQMRQRQGELGNSDYLRAYGFMVQAEIAILQAWIPKVYESARVLRIVGRDEEEFTAVVHFGQQFGPAAQQKAQALGGIGEGVRGIYDLSTGRYDVKAQLRKNPLTQRQENVELLTDLAPALPPQIQAKVVPIMLGEMDGTIMRKVSAALEPQEGTVPIEEAQKAQQVIDMLTQKVEVLSQQAEAKAQENASRERIAVADNATKIELSRMQLEHDAKMQEFEVRKLEMQAEIDAHQAQLARAHELESGDHAAAREFALREPAP